MANRAKILIVDDDPHFLALTSAVLASGGYEVFEASTGKDALEALARALPDMVVLDVVLPDMSGFEVCKQIKADPVLRSTFVVLHSGVSTSSDAQATGLDMGADGYIVKGTPKNEILARVKSLVRIKQAEDALKRAHDELDQRVKERTAELRAANQRLLSSEKALLERLRFEHFLSELSIGLVSTSGDQIDRGIESGLQQIVDFFNVNNCILIKGSADGAVITHAASADTASVLPVRTDIAPFFPWSSRQLRSGEIVRIVTLDQLPEEASVDRETFERIGIRSILIIPVSLEGSVSYTLSISSRSQERVWADEYIPRLQLMGEILVNAIERRRSAAQLEERLRFEQLLSGLSARFVNVAPDNVDAEVERGLSSIVEFFKVERCGLIQILMDDASWQITHVAVVQGVPGVPLRTRLPVTIYPWTYDKLIRNGETLVFSKLEDLPPEASTDRQTWTEWGIRSSLVIPITIGESLAHIIAIDSVLSEHVWPEEYIPRLRLLGEIFVNALDRKEMQQRLQDGYQEIEGLKRRLEKENVFLRKEVKVLSTSNEIVGESKAIKQALAEAERVAPTDSSVLILGETGAGKELVARHIHNLSRRKERPLVAVNCGSLPPSLIENEIFGREKGAYTGALTRMTGRFEAADGSTLFLDEIAELPYEVQSKLLRVLEEGKFERLGSTKTIHADVRLIAATNRDLSAEVAAGRFRSDLYYRLNVFPIRIAPLRQRLEDIPALVWAFVRELEKKLGKRIDTISKRSIESLQQYSWPGNVRELKNAVEHAMIVCEGKTLTLAAPTMGPQAKERDTLPTTLQDVERMHITSVLERTGWRLAGKDGAAEVLGMKRTTLQAKMRALGITRPSS
ncbi:MAG TPA: sigma 54-interacting transcriptional regulator [Syntrophorhabdales bacterium]|nr:sigma 54-interacting transcriptional regulator [Syntrophorhabdales bacterium]